MSRRSFTQALRSLLGEASTEIGRHRREFRWLAALAFCITFTYGVARSAAESLFLETYSKEDLPFVWLAGTAVMLVAVLLYTRFVVNAGPRRLATIMAMLSGLVLVILLLLRAIGVPGMPFALYVFKEVYIILLVEAFWSIANLTFAIRTARWVYGLFCAVGSTGGILGALSLTPLTRWMGTANTLWLVVPLLAVVAVAVHLYPKTPTVGQPASPKPLPGLQQIVEVMRNSPYLTLMLLLVACTQVVITLIDYEYNGAVSQAFPETDVRTPVMGQIAAAIDSVSVILQVATSFVLRFAGVAITLLVVPFLLGGAVIGYILLPVFGMMAVLKITSKSLDYSLHRAAKEILYIPLSLREKTEGKAIIDMLIYRFAKGGTSPLIGLITLAAVVPVPFVALALIAVWVGITSQLVGRYRKLVGTTRP